MSESQTPKFPRCSAIALSYPLLLWGLFLFLATPQAAAINERLSERFYTLGMLLVLACYGATGLGLLIVGGTLGVFACLRREAPSYLAWSAVAANILATFTALFYLKGQLTIGMALVEVLIGSLVVGFVRWGIDRRSKV